MDFLGLSVAGRAPRKIFKSHFNIICKLLSSAQKSFLRGQIMETALGLLQIQSHRIFWRQYLNNVIYYKPLTIQFWQINHLLIIIVDREEETENDEAMYDEDELYEYHGA